MIHETIKELRTDKGFSRYKVAKLAEVQENTVANLERGKGQISTLIKYCEAINAEIIIKPKK